jgi:hypothetical protein
MGFLKQRRERNALVQQARERVQEQMAVLAWCDNGAAHLRAKLADGSIKDRAEAEEALGCLETASRLGQRMFTIQNQWSQAGIMPPAMVQWRRDVLAFAAVHRDGNEYLFVTLFDHALSAFSWFGDEEFG